MSRKLRRFRIQKAVLLWEITFTHATRIRYGTFASVTLALPAASQSNVHDMHRTPCIMMIFLALTQYLVLSSNVSAHSWHIFALQITPEQREPTPVFSIESKPSLGAQVL